MPQLNASNGKCALATQVAAVGAVSVFTVATYQFYRVIVNATNGYVKLQLRAGNNGIYQGEFKTFVTPYNTSAAITATALAALITADTSLVNITITDLSNGTFTIESDTPSNGVQVKGEFGCEVKRDREAFNLQTYEGDAYLLAKVSGGNIRYTENPILGLSPTTSVGILIEDGGWFDIIGKNNILKSAFIEETADAVIDYQIYIA
jgi:hypothetical protein